MLISHDISKQRNYIEAHHFRDFLPEEAVRNLQLCCFRDGEYLCREGEKENYLYFLVEGKCRITRLLSNGKEALISFWTGFTVLGEVEMFQNVLAGSRRERVAESESVARMNVKAIDDVWCFRLPLVSTRECLMNDLGFLRFLCGELCKKMIRSDRNQSISLNYSVDECLAGYICCTCRNGLFRENHTHLAEYLGCSHRQLLRVLRRFCEEGILEKGRQAYRILDEERLEKMAGDIYNL